MVSVAVKRPRTSTSSLICSPELARTVSSAHGGSAATSGSGASVLGGRHGGGLIESGLTRSGRRVLSRPTLAARERAPGCCCAHAQDPSKPGSHGKRKTTRSNHFISSPTRTYPETGRVLHQRPRKTIRSE